MSYFDSKEEIINLQLTPYGRHLLSKGIFKPVYYAFFDDEIIYDSSYMDVSESKNEIEGRILNNTPVNKPQYNFSSLEQIIKNNTLLVQSENDRNKKLVEQDSADKNYALSIPLGKSSYNSIYAPAWNIKAIEGKIVTANQYIDNSDGTSGTLQPYLKIPQINLEKVKLLKYSFNQQLNITDTETSNKYRYATIEEDANNNASIYHYYSPKNILLDILEENVDDAKENFDIQFFIEEEKTVLQYGKPPEDSKVKFWRELSFFKKPVFIENNILLDTPKYVDDNILLNLTKENVELYFNVTVDREIELPPELSLRRGIFDITYASNTNTLTSSISYGPDCS